MKNFLFYYSYIGTRFIGTQKQKRLGSKDVSVSKYLESALLSLCPANFPRVQTCGRTDSGVHAINSTFQAQLSLPPLIDLKHQNFTKESYITFKLNDFFESSILDIRIHKTRVVPYEFDCRRHATTRTYLYRFAISKKNISLPISELNRCYIVHIKDDCEFDVESVEKACKLFEGVHDFSNFAKLREDNEKITVRRLHEVKLLAGKPFFNSEFDGSVEDFTFYDIILTGHSFLYNQVRRIAGILIYVGQGNISLEKIEELLNNPESGWPTQVRVADACGLYKLNISYSPEVFLQETFDNLPRNETGDIVPGSLRTHLEEIYKGKTVKHEYPEQFSIPK